MHSCLCRLTFLGYLSIWGRPPPLSTFRTGTTKIRVVTEFQQRVTAALALGSAFQPWTYVTLSASKTVAYTPRKVVHVDKGIILLSAHRNLSQHCPFVQICLKRNKREDNNGRNHQINGNYLLTRPNIHPTIIS